MNETTDLGVSYDEQEMLFRITLLREWIYKDDLFAIMGTLHADGHFEYIVFHLTVPDPTEFPELCEDHHDLEWAGIPPVGVEAADAWKTMTDKRLGVFVKRTQ